MSVEGPSFGEAQYSASYEKVAELNTGTNNPAVFLPGEYQGNLTVGSTIDTSTQFLDLDNGFDGTSNAGYTFFVLDDDSSLVNGGFEILSENSFVDNATSDGAINAQITLESEWAGKTLYFYNAITDDLGNAEMSWQDTIVVTLLVKYWKKLYPTVPLRLILRLFMR